MQAYRNFSIINKFILEDEYVVKAYKLYQDKKLTVFEKCNMCFTLAKMYEDIGHFSNAYAFLVEGNALRKKLLNYSIELIGHILAGLKKFNHI